MKRGIMSLSTEAEIDVDVDVVCDFINDYASNKDIEDIIEILKVDLNEHIETDVDIHSAADSNRYELCKDIYNSKISDKELYEFVESLK